MYSKEHHFKRQKRLLSFLPFVVGAIHESPENKLTQYGEFAKEIIEILPDRFHVSIPKYVIMPNHIHMIIVILEAEGIKGGTDKSVPYKKYDIPNVVGKFKAGVTRIVGNAFMHSVKNPIWQSSYHDHIIRDGKDYQKIGEYIDTNVLKWELDCFL